MICESKKTSMPELVLLRIVQRSTVFAEAPPTIPLRFSVTTQSDTMLPSKTAMPVPTVELVVDLLFDEMQWLTRQSSSVTIPAPSLPRAVQSITVQFAPTSKPSAFPPGDEPTPFASEMQRTTRHPSPASRPSL